MSKFVRCQTLFTFVCFRFRYFSLSASSLRYFVSLSERRVASVVINPCQARLLRIPQEAALGTRSAGRKPADSQLGNQ